MQRSSVALIKGDETAQTSQADAPNRSEVAFPSLELSEPSPGSTNVLIAANETGRPIHVALVDVLHSEAGAEPPLNAKAGADVALVDLLRSDSFVSDEGTSNDAAITSPPPDSPFEVYAQKIASQRPSTVTFKSAPVARCIDSRSFPGLSGISTTNASIMARPAKAAASASTTTKTAKTRQTETNSQSGLKRKAPRLSHVTRDDNVDWDEGLRSDSAESPPKKTKYTTKNAQRAPSQRAPKTKKRASKAPAKSSPARSSTQKVPRKTTTRPADQSISSNRPRRACPKSAIYVEDSDSEEVDDGDQLISQSKGRAMRQAIDRPKVQVKDSQPKDGPPHNAATQNVMADTINIFSSSLPAIPAVARQDLAQHNSAEGVAQASPIETSAELQGQMKSLHQDSAHDTGTTEPPSAVSDKNDNQIREGEEAIEDSYPKQTRDLDNPEFRQSMNFSGAVLGDPGVNQQRPPTGNPKSFIRSVNHARNSSAASKKTATAPHNSPSNKVIKAKRHGPETPSMIVTKKSTERTGAKRSKGTPGRLSIKAYGKRKRVSNDVESIFGAENIAAPTVPVAAQTASANKSMTTSARAEQSVARRADLIDSVIYNAAEGHELETNKIDKGPISSQESTIENNTIGDLHYQNRMEASETCFDTNVAPPPQKVSLEHIQPQDPEVTHHEGRAPAAASLPVAANRTAHVEDSISGVLHDAQQRYASGNSAPTFIAFPQLRKDSPPQPEARGFSHTPRKSVDRPHTTSRKATVKQHARVAAKTVTPRRTVIISFGPEGPRNQGQPSASRPVAQSDPQSELPSKSERHDQSKRDLEGQLLDKRTTSRPGILDFHDVKEVPSDLAAQTPQVHEASSDLNMSGEAPAAVALGRNASQTSRVDDFGSPYPDDGRSDEPKSAKDVGTSLEDISSAPEDSSLDFQPGAGSETEDISEQISDESEYQEQQVEDESSLLIGRVEGRPPSKPPAPTSILSPAHISPAPTRPRRQLRPADPQPTSSDRQEIKDKMWELISVKKNHAASDTINTASFKKSSGITYSLSQKQMPPPLLPSKIQTSSRKEAQEAEKRPPRAARPIIQLPPNVSEPPSSSPVITITCQSKPPSPIPPSEVAPASSPVPSPAPSFTTNLHDKGVEWMQSHRGVAEEDHVGKSRGTASFEADTTLVDDIELDVGNKKRKVGHGNQDRSRSSSPESQSCSEATPVHGGSGQRSNVFEQKQQQGKLSRSQKNLRDIVISIADGFLSRLGDAEGAIKAKVQIYRNGGTNMLNELDQRWNETLTEHDRQTKAKVKRMKKQIRKMEKTVIKSEGQVPDRKALRNLLTDVESRHLDLKERLQEKIKEQKIILHAHQEAEEENEENEEDEEAQEEAEVEV